jgi:triphosphoribosyl-dephospho-CoA synthase
MTTDTAVDAVFDVAAAAQLACLLEATAPKPGNVSPGRSFADSRYEDYLASAAAIGGPLVGVGARPLGRTIRLAVESTAQWTRSNTNLGLVLLLAPLARAALEKGVGSLFRGESEEKEGVGTHLRGKGDGSLFRHENEEKEGIGSGKGVGPLFRAASGEARGKKGDGSLFRGAVHHVLDATTVEDARDVYAAIRMAAPGGLGRVDEQDIAQEPDRTLLEVMRLAADRDGVAREYATAFEATFDVGAPALDRARTAGLSWNDAIVETFLTLLAAGPDTHIARRAGPALAADVTRRARDVLAAGGVRSKDGRRAIDDMDRALRDPRHAANPGTTADLTAAAIFVVLIGGAGGRHGAR